jgi:hypothetical protein
VLLVDTRRYPFVQNPSLVPFVCKDSQRRGHHQRLCVKSSPLTYCAVAERGWGSAGGVWLVSIAWLYTVLSPQPASAAGRDVLLSAPRLVASRGHRCTMLALCQPNSGRGPAMITYGSLNSINKKS